MKIMTNKQFEMELAKERDKWYNERFQNERIENLERQLMEMGKRLEEIRYKLEYDKCVPVCDEVNRA